MTRLFRVFVHVYIHHFEKMVSKGAVSIHYDIILSFNLVGGLSISNHNKCTMHLPTQKHAIEITLMDCTQLKTHRLISWTMLCGQSCQPCCSKLFQLNSCNNMLTITVHSGPHNLVHACRYQPGTSCWFSQFLRL